MITIAGQHLILDYKIHGIAYVHDILTMFYDKQYWPSSLTHVCVSMSMRIYVAPHLNNFRWQCCLSLELVSSISTGSTIIASLLAIWCLRPCVRILHSAKENNLSPFDCISPEPGTKANCQWGRVGWMLTHHRDVLSSSSCSLILDTSVALLAGIQSAGYLVSETRVWILHSTEGNNLSPF